VGLLVQGDPGDPEELVGVLSDHLGAHEVGLEIAPEIEQATQAPVLVLERLELADALAEARVLRGEARVVFFDVDEIDVVAPEVRDPAGQRGRRVLDRGGDPDDHFVRPRDLLRVFHARAQEPERHRQREQHDHEIAVALEVHWAALALGSRRPCRKQREEHTEAESATRLLVSSSS
jgi:hypothetical protein